MGEARLTVSAEAFPLPPMSKIAGNAGIAGTLTGLHIEHFCHIFSQPSELFYIRQMTVTRRPIETKKE